METIDVSTTVNTPIQESRSRWAKSRSGIIRHTVLMVFLLLMIYPLLWMISSAFKPGHLILTEPGLIPSEFTLANFTEGWNALGRPFGFFFINSAIIAIGAIAGNLISCSLAAYALARLNFRMKKVYFPIVLLTLMLPFHVLIIPQYIVFSNLGLVNTFVPLLLPKFLATDAFFIFLMVQFIRSIPRDLDRAAQVDGASAYRIFWDIILPLMRPALITTTIFTFIWTWNDFLTPLIYLTRAHLFTVTVGLNALVDSESQLGVGRLFAMSLLSLAPVLLVFTFAQRYLIRGIATTGLK